MELFPPIRLAASGRRNHWWNVPFQLTGRGITSRPMGSVDSNTIFTIDFDFVDHQLLFTTGDGRAVSFLEEFAARYSGKVSPVHHFWHTFDIAPQCPVAVTDELRGPGRRVFRR